MIDRRIAVSAAAAQLPALTDFLRAFCSAAGLAAAQVPSFELALEEVFMNIVLHGSPADGAVEVSLALDGEALTLTVADDGPAFDPLSLPAPDVTATLAERPAGGLGVFLVRQMMDAVRYERLAGRNAVHVTKRVARASGGPA